MVTAGKVVVQVEADIKKLQKDMKTVQKDLDSTKKSSDKTAKGFGGLTKAAGLLGGAFVGMKALQTGKDLFLLANRANALEKSFDNLTKAVGFAGDEMLGTLKDATLNAVSDMELMQAANQALLLGIDPNALPEMFEGAASVAAATGSTITQAIGDITTGIGRQSKLILDNLGIIVSAEDANKVYAESMGIVGRALTDVERKQAFTNAAMDALAINAKNVGDVSENAATQVQQFNAKWANFKVIAGEALQDGVLPLLDGIVAISDQLESGMNFRETNEALDEYINGLNGAVLVTDTAQETLREKIDAHQEEREAMLISKIEQMALNSVYVNSEEDLKRLNEIYKGFTGETLPGFLALKGQEKTVVGEINDLNATANESSEATNERHLGEARAIQHKVDFLRKQLLLGGEAIEQRDAEGKLTGKLVDAQTGKEIPALQKLEDARKKAVDQFKGINSGHKDEIENIDLKKDALDKALPTFDKNVKLLTEEEAALAGIPASLASILEQGGLLDGQTFTFNIVQNVTTKRSGGGVQKQMGGIIHAQAGIEVPGQGSGDKVPAMLEPGEFVLNRKAVKAVGMGNLNRINSSIPRFATGGAVGGGAGGGINIYIESVQGLDAESIAEALQDKLEDMIST